MVIVLWIRLCTYLNKHFFIYFSQLVCIKYKYYEHSVYTDKTRCNEFKDIHAIAFSMFLPQPRVCVVFTSLSAVILLILYICVPTIYNISVYMYSIYTLPNTPQWYFIIIIMTTVYKVYSYRYIRNINSYPSLVSCRCLCYTKKSK